jgi:L-alanine-DL-glutamate epimerase-like enolase superfamily enzyme
MLCWFKLRPLHRTYHSLPTCCRCRTTDVTRCDSRQREAKNARQSARAFRSGIFSAASFQPFDLTWLEEPTIPEDPEGHGRIVREGGLPIAAGENLRTVWEFKLYIDCGGVTFPEPDVTNCGGVTPFMKIAHLAEAFNLPVTSHGAQDVTVHLLAACPNRSYLEAHGFGLE